MMSFFLSQEYFSQLQDMTDVLPCHIHLPVCLSNTIWRSGEWPTLRTQSLVITLPKKGNLQQCQNYHTISLISHPSKVMLKIWRSYWTDWSHKRRRSSLKNRQASEREGAPQSRSSTYAFAVRNSFSIRKTSTTSSQISNRPSTGFGMQLFGQPWRSTSAPALSKSSKNLFNKSTSAVLFIRLETGSEQQLESDRDVYSRPPS